MESLHFGAGKIGRGFIGALLAGSGFRVTFADAQRGVVEAINRSGGYCVYAVGEQSSVLRVEGVSAVLADSEQCVERFVEADLVTTAVSMGALPAVAPIVARGIAARCHAEISLG